jgi:hypothetical protein
MTAMNTKRKELVKRVAALPEEFLDEVDQTVAEIVHFHAEPEQQATPDELEGIDHGLKATREGRFAADQGVEELLASLRGS